MFVVPQERRKVHVGQRFDRLEVAGAAFYGVKYRQFVVLRCDCGSFTLGNVQDLCRGTKRSCGCLNSELARKRATKHGLNGTPLHKTWKGMKVRCLYPTHDHYESYGGRGIKICDEWMDFRNFHEWAMSIGWKPGLEIDRIDPNGNYEPSNCRFATRAEQMQNCRNTKQIEAFGETKTITEWAADTRCAVGRKCLNKRIRMGWDAETAITKEPRA